MDFFVRSRDPRGEVGIVAKIADKKYVTFRGDWVISSQVGAGGARRMYDFYKLIKELRDGELRCYLTGRLYNANDFNSLFRGECYPGFVEKPGGYNMHWWDDFADTGTSHLTREQLEEYWGREFVLAQDIVLAKVRDRGPSEVKKGS